MARKNKGRQKVEMVKMQNESNLQVTFSKRRSGLFKKASELCTLCGAEIAVVVFSPGNKVFSFGHPSVESLIERFLTRNPQPTSGTLQLIEAHRNANVRELNAQLTHVTSQLEMERKRGDDLNKMRRDGHSAECWWESPVDELDRPQLDQLRASLEELKKNVANHADRILMQTSKPPPPPPPPPAPPLLPPLPYSHYFHGSSSHQSSMFPFDSDNNVGYNPGYSRGFF